MQFIKILIALVFGPLSLFSSIILCFFYLGSKLLRSQSTPFIIGLTFGQCLFDVSWIITFRPVATQITGGECSAVSSIVFYGMLILCMYNLALSYVIHINVSRIKINMMKTGIIHVFIQVTAITFVIVFNALDIPD